MFTLPDEILELIIRYNNKSIRTLISWSLIYPHIRNQVSKEVGIITIQDGLISKFHNILGFQCLISENVVYDNKSNTIASNYINIISDDIDDEYILNEKQSFALFISRFNNLLIVIETTRQYSANLYNTLTRVANSCHYGTNICVFYKTHTNFLSKLYFKPLQNILSNISLTELYIFGDSKFQSSNPDNLVDIDTLFQTVYIEDLKSIYSLDIIDDTKVVSAPQLVTIKKINYNENINIVHFLRYCTSIQNINYLRFPILNNLKGKSTFVLPPCKRITLNEFSSDVSHPTIDGSKITEMLTLQVTLRSTDPFFKNLSFPKVIFLHLSLFDFKVVNLVNCDFNQVRHLNIENCLVPWDNFNLSKNTNEDFIKLNVKIKTNNWQHLSWLISCPFHIQNLEIEGYLMESVSLSLLSNSFLSDPFIKQDLDIIDLNNSNKIENIALNIDSLEHCRFLQELISKSSLSASSSSFNITINENKLRKSICVNNNNKLIQRLDISVPKMNHLTLLLLQLKNNISDDNFSSKGNSINMGNFNFNSANIHQGSLSILNEKFSSKYFKTKEIIPVETISPSQFRRNTLAGLSSEEARKQSIITFDSTSSMILDATSNRRSFSLDSGSLFSNLHYSNNNEYIVDEFSDLQDFISFNLQGTQCPNIVTLNINMLETLLLKFDNLSKDTKIPLLQIWFALDTPVFTYEKLIIDLTNRIIDLLDYPYDQIVNSLAFQKLQLFIDFSESNENIYSSFTFGTLTNDLCQLLALKGRYLKFVEFKSSERDLMEISPTLSACIRL